MIPVNNTLDAIFFGCLLFGVLFTLVSLALGGADLGVDGDAGSLGPGSWLFNVSAILAFIAWFGGVGLLARQAAGLPAVLSVVLAVAGGVVGGSAAGKGIRRLSNAGEVLDPEAYELPGTLARVVSSIRSGGTGEIIYEQQGLRQVAAARSEDGGAIARGVEVVVLRYHGGVATVAPWDELMSPRPEPERAEPAPALSQDSTMIASSGEHH